MLRLAVMCGGYKMIPTFVRRFGVIESKLDRSDKSTVQLPPLQPCNGTGHVCKQQLNVTYHAVLGCCLRFPCFSWRACACLLGYVKPCHLRSSS